MPVRRSFYARPESSEDSTAPPVPSGYWEATQGHDSAVPMHGVFCLRSNAASTPQPRIRYAISAAWRPYSSVGALQGVWCHQVS
jgi:hypothetical protein